MNPWIVGIGSSLLGAVAVLVLKYVIQKILEFRGEYSGTWKDQIFDQDDQVIKRDKWFIRQRGDEIEGVIQRFFPEEQTHRRWDMSGKINGKEFIGMFWTINKSFTSRGCFYLYQEDDDLFRGHYLTLSRSGDVEWIKVELTRTRQRFWSRLSALWSM